MFKLKATLAAAAALCLFSSGSVFAEEKVEVLHWWTSGGEAAALNVLKKDLESQGVTWNDMPVAGGSGVQAMTVLRARVTAGNAPTAVQMLGFDILDWSGEGVLADLNKVAEEENWDAVIPDAIKRFAKPEGVWIAAPVNVHSTNWVWANKAIFDELNLKQPATWDELIASLDKIKAAGYIAMAHGGQAWQDGTVFDSVVLATGGPEFYQKAMNELDEAALGSDTMKTVFDRMAQLRGYVDDNFSGRDWNLATAMVINKEAGVQFMGDWAKGEFLSASKKPGEDFLCFRFPDSQGAVLFNSDQFVMFAVGEEQRPAQEKLAMSVMSPAFQQAFNKVKGSVMARTDVDASVLDACGQQGQVDLAEANKSNKLFGSMAHGHGAPSGIKSAVFDVVTAHFNGEYDSAAAVEELAAAVQAAK